MNEQQTFSVVSHDDELHCLLAGTVFRRLAVCEARTGASQPDEEPLWSCRVSVRRVCQQTCFPRCGFLLSSPEQPARVSAMPCC